MAACRKIPAISVGVMPLLSAPRVWVSTSWERPSAVRIESTTMLRSRMESPPSRPQPAPQQYSFSSSCSGRLKSVALLIAASTYFEPSTLRRIDSPRAARSLRVWSVIALPHGGEGGNRSRKCAQGEHGRQRSPLAASSPRAPLPPQRVAAGAGFHTPAAGPAVPLKLQLRFPRWPAMKTRIGQPDRPQLEPGGQGKPGSGRIDRRTFMSSVALVGAGVAGLGAIEPARAEVLFPPGGGGFGGGAFGAGGSAGNGVYRSENDLYDCEVEGKLPADLSGIFYRIGPDPQYPKPAKYVHDIAFDGEGHISAFHIQNGHVDFRSRYVQTQRWKAQRAARRSLFGMYRNPTTDDPSVKGVSRGTANTQIFYHHGKLLAMKEDSPPVVLNPYTLDTLDDYYT